MILSEFSTQLAYFIIKSLIIFRNKEEIKLYSPEIKLKQMLYIYIQNSSNKFVHTNKNVLFNK